MRAPYPIERKRRTPFFPFDGERNSQRCVNDPTRDENRRWCHGTDPLRDGYDPTDGFSPGETPIARRNRRRRSKIPI